MNIKRTVIGISLISMLAIGAGAASAQRGGEPNRPDRPGAPMGMPGRWNGEWGMDNRPVGDVMQAVADIISEQTGLTAREFIVQVREGSTPAEVIAANDGDVDAVRAEVIAVITDEINQAVADERLTQERADTLLENLEMRVDSVLNGEMAAGLRDRFNDRRDRGGALGARDQVALELAAEQTGLTTDEILAEIEAGATLGDVLRANEVNIEAFADLLIAQAEEQMAANQAERMEAARQRLLDRLNATAADSE